jgi:Uma2 family endonuclease
MSTAIKLMTVDEFLPWAEGQEGRWELHDGVPVLLSSGPLMMSPERLGHTRVKGKVFVALAEGVKRKALPCEAFTDGVSVKIDARTTFEPDASVICGPRRPDDVIAVADPVVVVEVLSVNTAAVDHGRKLSGYFSLPSVQHYLILDPDRRVAIHHKRGAGDAIETRVLSEGAVKLDPPGFEVAVEAMFPPP